MELLCDLEVDVNGQEIFFVDKKMLSSFSNKLNNLFGHNLIPTTIKLKVIFHEFPGGAEGFELIARFCYTNGKTEVTPANIFLLHTAANFMEMNTDGFINLKDQLDKSLEGVSYYTWLELLVALKQCQDLLPATNSLCLLQKILDFLVGHIALPCVSSPHSSSSDSSRFQFSGDILSTDTIESIRFLKTWWFEDLVFLDIELIKRVVKTMASQNFDHATISKFLFYYQKSVSADKCKVTEVVVNLLSLLDKSSVSCKGLFDIFRVAMSLKVSKCCKKKLESLIGLKLDQATLDDLLVPSPQEKDYVYDVSFVLRLLKSFLLQGSCHSTPLRKVSKLMDMYAMEVAPDSYLKPFKFTALALALPDSARDSCDKIYQAMDIYLEVHRGMSEIQKMEICSALNYEKLSPENLKHLAQNSKFPSRTTIKALLYQQSKSELGLLKDTHYLKTFAELRYCYFDKGNTEDEKLRANFQGKQWRVVGLEKVCRKLQTQMTNTMKPRLPKLCS